VVFPFFVFVFALASAKNENRKTIKYRSAEGFDGKSIRDRVSPVK
jgi:hypothetical protein